MSDITQAATGEQVVFSANTTEADNWMREHYGDQEVTFSLPSEAADAQDFKKAAQEAGLTISSL